jgi:hypothetical protein
MRTTLVRILKLGIPVALGLIVIGGLFGQLATVWVEGSSPPAGPVLRTDDTSAVAPVLGGLIGPVSLTMVCWEFLFVTGYEL